MTKNPYDRFQPEELILRDELAIDRTILSNERTVLAYLRSALTLFIVGVTFLHFFEKGPLLYIGIIFIPFGLAVGIFGYIRYRNMGKRILSVRISLNQVEDDHESVEQPGGGDTVNRAPHP